MDVESVLKDQFFKPLVRTIIPGVIASAPFVEIVCLSFPGVSAFRNSQSLAFFGLVGLVATAVGLILEDVGSRIESHFDECYPTEKPSKKGRSRAIIELANKITEGAECPKKAEHESAWWRYLLLPDAKRAHADNYLESIVLRLKFELSMAPALLLSSGGLGLLFLVAGHSYWWLLSLAVPIGLGCYLAFESRKSWLLLHTIRVKVLAAARR